MNDYKLRICSDLKHEEIVVDICYKNETVATINQDRGLNDLEIEIFPVLGKKDSWVFSYEEFISSNSVL